MLSQLSAGQQRAQAGQQPVVVSLAFRAGVALGGIVGCRSVDHRALVVRVAHARGGQLGQHRIQRRAGFRGQPAAKPRHPVEALLAHGDAAAAGAVVIAEGAVGVEAVHQPLSQFGQLVGAELGGQPGQMDFGFASGLAVDVGGQVAKEVADHPHLRLADMACTLSGRGGGQLRCHRFTGQGAALPELGGIADAPAGLGAGDPQPGGQRRGQLPAQLLLAGLLADLVDQPVPGDR